MLADIQELSRMFSDFKLSFVRINVNVAAHGAINVNVAAHCAQKQAFFSRQRCVWLNQALNFLCECLF